MPEIRGFIAATLDGYIADTDGGMEWLNEFGDSDYGYEDFIAEIDTVVIGRKTFDQVTKNGRVALRRETGPHRLEIESATALEAGMLRLDTVHPTRLRIRASSAGSRRPRR